MTIRTRILAVFAAAALTVPVLSACGTYHDATYHDATYHDATYHDATYHDATYDDACDPAATTAIAHPEPNDPACAGPR